MGKLELFEGYETVLEFGVTDEIYNLFQTCSKDVNPLHTDISFAKSKGYKDKVMYGNILNAFVSYAIGMKLPTPDVVLQTQDIQYKNPVYCNDVLTMHLKTDSIFESVNSVKLKYEFINEENKCVAKGKILIGVFL